MNTARAVNPAAMMAATDAGPSVLPKMARATPALKPTPSAMRSQTTPIAITSRAARRLVSRFQVLRKSAPRMTVAALTIRPQPASARRWLHRPGRRSGSRRGPEVCLVGAGQRPQLAHRPFGDDPAGVHDRDPPAER